jgi:hypothetical protein
MTKDLRRYARQTNARLLVGFFLLLFIVGDGLIWAVYGREAALLGLLCLSAGLIPLVLIYAALWAMEQIAKRADQ